MERTYFIDHVTPGSTNLGNRKRTQIVGKYQDAVNAAHEIFKGLEKKTGVAVHSDRHCVRYWHRISAKGIVEDRNGNSGVSFPESYDIIFKDNGYRDAPK